MTRPRFAKIRVRKGLYLALSDDGRQLYRFSSYEEDGSAHRSDGTPVLGTFWLAHELRADIGHDHLFRRLVERDDDGVIISVDADVATEGTWREVASTEPRLGDLWRRLVQDDKS